MINMTSQHLKNGGTLKNSCTVRPKKKEMLMVIIMKKANKKVYDKFWEGEFLTAKSPLRSIQNL